MTTNGKHILIITWALFVFAERAEEGRFEDDEFYRIAPGSLVLLTLTETSGLQARALDFF